MEIFRVIGVVAIVMLMLFLVFPRRKSPPDPCRDCEYHRDMRCPHVDGPECNMETCGIRKGYLDFLG